MINDFKAIKYRFQDDIKIYAISDVHLGAAEHMADAWIAFCDKIKNEKNAYVILAGDLINNATRSSVSNIFEETMRPREQKRRMVEILEPIKDKILCCVSGNHERRSIKDVDDDPTYDICCKLDIEDKYRQNAAFIALTMGKNGKNTKKGLSTYTICVTHGAGGGVLTGSSVNRNERFAQSLEGVDVLITGHTHKGAVTRPQRVVFDARTGYITNRTMLIVTSESWLNYGGYALQKMLPPAECGNPQILSFKAKRDKRIELTW